MYENQTPSFAVSFLPQIKFIFPKKKNKRIIVKVGASIKESISTVGLYHHAQFTRGTVFFKNGKTAAAALNYNRYLDEMQFITPKGDSLTLVNENKMAFIPIAKDTFFYEQGYVKLVSNIAKVKVGAKTKIAGFE